MRRENTKSDPDPSPSSGTWRKASRSDGSFGTGLQKLKQHPTLHGGVRPRCCAAWKGEEDARTLLRAVQNLWCPHCTPEKSCFSPMTPAAAWGVSEHRQKDKHFEREHEIPGELVRRPPEPSGTTSSMVISRWCAVMVAPTVGPHFLTSPRGGPGKTSPVPRDFGRGKGAYTQLVLNSLRVALSISQKAPPRMTNQCGGVHVFTVAAALSPPTASTAAAVLVCSITIFSFGKAAWSLRSSFTNAVSASITETPGTLGGRGWRRDVSPQVRKTVDVQNDVSSRDVISDNALVKFVATKSFQNVSDSEPVKKVYM